MRKGTKNLIIAVAAVFAAALLACLIVLAALPAGTGARYAEDEMYSGVVANDLNSSHSHSGWTAITNGSFSGGTYTITVATSATVNYYLTEDVTGDIKIETSGTSSSNAPVVNICLNGHALTGTGSGSVITIGDPSSSGYVTVNLYDCGGESTWNQHYYRYLYEDEDAVVDGEPFPTRYDFSLTDEEIKAGEYDGCVRGGLITGGNATSQYYGGGVTVGYHATLNMYGGTIAGNEAFGQYSAGGVNVSRGTLNLYGGTVEGNYGNYGVRYGSSGGVYVYVNSNGYLNMYGGEIKNNHGVQAGGVSLYTYSTSGGVNIYGGIISGNYSGEYGGGVHVQGTSYRSSLYVYGGIISDNIAKNEGGGICVSSFANMYLYGGTVTGNRVLNPKEIDGSGISKGGSGGGICYEGGTNSFYIHGAPCVYGNYVDGMISNLELDFDLSTSNDTYLIVNDYLTEGAKVGINSTMLADKARITSTSVAADSTVLKASAKYFIPDDRNYGIELYDSTSNPYLRFYKKQA